MITRGLKVVLFLFMGILLVCFGAFLSGVTEASFSSVIVCFCGFYFCYEAYATTKH